MLNVFDELKIITGNGNIAYFHKYTLEHLYYRVYTYNGEYEFLININDVKENVFNDKMKAVTLMYWIRKAQKENKLIKIDENN